MEAISNFSLKDIVDNYVIDPTYWTGPNPTYNQTFFIRFAALVAFGSIWAVWFKLVYIIGEALTKAFFPGYKKLNNMQKVDWSSRVVACVFILVNGYQAILVLLSQGGHSLVAVDGSDTSSFETGQWKLDTSITGNLYYLLFLYWGFAFGYELYDLKNCWDIRMMSGVVHHIVLLIVMPCNWAITCIAVPAIWMTSCTYLTNIPAHIRSFMVHTGYRDTKFYKLNKWAWWYSYVVFRLFGIPWFSAQMWFTMAPIRVQAPLVCIVYYFSGMAVHYALSLYWFVEMTKTMLPPSREMKRVGSFPLVPKNGKKTKKTKNPGGHSESESEDDGGQKFD